MISYYGHVSEEMDSNFNLIGHEQDLKWQASIALCCVIMIKTYIIIMDVQFNNKIHGARLLGYIYSRITK